MMICVTFLNYLHFSILYNEYDIYASIKCNIYCLRWTFVGQLHVGSYLDEPVYSFSFPHIFYKVYSKTSQIWNKNDILIKF